VSTPLVRFEGVSKSFGDVAAVRDVSLDIAEGEFFALLGPSGCGKTTLMRLLAGFETPDAGRVLLDGKDIAALPPHRRPVHMMFQSYALFPHLTVRQNVAFGLKGMERAAALIRVGEMLALLRLEELGDRKPDQLSGGQQQRVALARALAPRPRILLLDEPLAALDRKLREETQIELMALQRRLRLTFMIVTHDQDEAMVVADRMAVMREGEVVQVGPPREVYERPVNRYVAGFIGEVNLFATGAQWVAVRPERLSLHADHVAGGLPGRITEIAYFGDRTRYVVATEIGQDVRVSLVGAPVHKLGDAVWVGQPRGGGVEVAE
jgi:ABC-type Fe3+/spermidine/putrescine transport system ATPase subunit